MLHTGFLQSWGAGATLSSQSMGSGAEVGLPHQAIEMPEGPEVPVGVDVEQVLCLVHGVVTG